MNNMMNQKLDDEKLKKEVVTLMFDMFNILRGESISSEKYQVLLFLLSLCKEGLITREILERNSDIKSEIRGVLEDSDNIAKNEYLVIYESFYFAIEQLSNLGLSDLIQIMLRIEPDYLSENFSKIFDSILYKIAKYQGKNKGESIQPVELTRLVNSLANLAPNASIYNPFAGLGSFGAYLDNEHKYLGQEIMTETWALGALRMRAYSYSFKYKYVCENSLLKWPESNEKFDLIVSHPPLGMKIGSGFKDLKTDARTVEEFLLKEGVSSLTTEGKLIAIMAQGFLFRGGGEGRLREQLIDEDLIDTVISLPGGLLYNTGIPIVLLVLDKNKRRPGVVRFVQGEQFVTTVNIKEKALDDLRLLSAIDSESPDSEVIRLVDNSQIRDLDYNLNVPRYFQKSVEGVKLRDFLSFVRGHRGELPENAKLIKIKDLKDGQLDFKLDLSKVEASDKMKHSARIIDESCLLLAARWTAIKPTFFEYSSIPILLNSDIIPFKLDNEIADTAYLINELQSDYVLEQLDSYRTGTTIPMIRRDDLLEVVIKLPSLEEQKAKMLGILEVSNRIEMLQKERNTLAHGKASTDYSEFASLKHTLGRPRQNILDWSDNLIHFLSKDREGFELLNKDFLEFYETDILSALKEINRDVDFMTKVLEKGENGFKVEDYNKSLIPLSEMNSLVSDLSNNGLNFIIKKLITKGDDWKNRGIYGSKILLQTLFDNLLTNANKYGFKSKKEGNEVVIELKVIDDFLSLEVRNNGFPFPKNYDRDKFITKYSTADESSGSGLGGYDIHRIASEFENIDWDLVLNEDPIYPVKFQFQFPIKLVK